MKMDRAKVIKGLETYIPMKYETNEEKECRHEQCPYGRENYKPMNGCFWDLMSDALELLKDQEGYVSVPFSWLVKFCTHIDFTEPLTDVEREVAWRQKLRQQFGINAPKYLKKEEMRRDT